VKDTSLCGLGNTAPNPVLTTLKYFREEYDQHVRERKCPAKVCRKLLTFTVDPVKCVEVGHGCGQCSRNCPEDAISGKKGIAHYIDPELCEGCGICVDVCNFDAITVE
jgi:Pyruvate/2-oxoacid:ferredoxin oxidoreductase delta subunit